ncbi:hypothetical protein KP509_04G013200 [Ceratopteris richardii]|uniref:Glutaredoxin domain-containing protein n=1 Tax=Ceratopteris richardii TaxID=49495 RepID=A0A8T2UXE4_CERRI|nr:hypothetical protein KP509_04G013200 [Ceratopteris richardii]
MGCILSKHLKQETTAEDEVNDVRPIEVNPIQIIPGNEIIVDEYHHHLVEFISSSYGLQEVDFPSNAPESSQRNEDWVRSIDENYKRLSHLDSVDLISNPQYQLISVPPAGKPRFQRSTSAPMPHSNNPLVHEIINVSDIMQGLEEACFSSSLSEDDGRVSPRISQSGSLSPLLSSTTSGGRKHEKMGKTFSFDGQGKHLELGYSGIDNVPHYKLPLLPLTNSKGLSSYRMTHFSNRFKVSSYAKHEPSYRTQNNDACYRDAALMKSKLPPYESIKTLIVDKSMCKNDGPYLTSERPSSISYSTSSRRMKLTLNLECDVNETEAAQDLVSGNSLSRKLTAETLSEPESPIFDPYLLASYENALKELKKENWSLADSFGESDENIKLSEKIKPDADVRYAFHISKDHRPNFDKAFHETSLKMSATDVIDKVERRCPPGNDDAVVLYTTTSNYVMESFDHCNQVRDILTSLSTRFQEKDIFIDSAYQNELRELLGETMSVPALFIKGMYTGDFEDILTLHEKGKLSSLLEGLSENLSPGICDHCENAGFIPCSACFERCKVVVAENSVSGCAICNESGLIKCPECL